MAAKKQNLKSQKGFTLIEAGIATAILAIITLGTSSVITSGMQAQQNARVTAVQETIGNIIVADLRMDVRYARQGSVSITNGGSRLTLTNGQNQVVVYSFAGNTLTKTVDAGPALNYATIAGNDIILNINCQPCFQFFPAAPGPNDPPGRSITLGAMTVVDANPQSGSPDLDIAFGRMNYTVTNVMFDQQTAKVIERRS